MSMTFKNGSFYLNGEKVPLEFGNKDQLALMNKAEALKEGALAYVDFSSDDDDTALEYTCLCGCRFRREYKIEEWNELQKDKFRCKDCDMKYIIDGEKYEHFVIVRFDKK